MLSAEHLQQARSSPYAYVQYVFDTAMTNCQLQISSVTADKDRPLRGCQGNFKALQAANTWSAVTTDVEKLCVSRIKLAPNSMVLMIMPYAIH